MYEEGNSGARKTESEIKSEFKKFVLYYEGIITERDYFEGIRDNKKELGINQLIEILSNPRERKDAGRSNIKTIIEDVESEKEKFDGTLLEENDELWIIFDKDSIPNDQYINALKYAYVDNENHNLGFTNRAFEFWLLMHFDGVKEYLDKELYDNEKDGSGTSFLTNEVNKKKSGSLYGNKNKHLNFDNFKSNLNKAIENSKLYETDINKLYENIGTNVGILLERFLI